MHIVICLIQQQVTAEHVHQRLVHRCDLSLDMGLPQAGGFQHFAVMQLHDLLCQFALFQRIGERPQEPGQRIAQRQGLHRHYVVVLGAAIQRVVVGSAVQPGLVAKVVADGR